MLHNFLESTGIGNKSKNNGILFLVSTGERKVRIEVGYGLEGRINDGKAGRILDNYVVPYLKNNDWDNGIKNGFNAILEEVCSEYEITVDGSIAAVNQSNETEISDEEAASIGIFIIVLIAGIVARFKMKKSKNKISFVARYYYICNNLTMYHCRRNCSFIDVFDNQFYYSNHHNVWTS